ncbi:Uncharacterized protein dnm_079030 [Desulfonema magnum]|uniref:Uncharacterized protein n=1 Tax=Desulfonema magnum TaxID=45655 RepID=A0A975GSA5_9BACT|nr:Uncharacterized protein dnm_079030 [Desulfonema magnum]
MICSTPRHKKKGGRDKACLVFACVYIFVSRSTRLPVKQNITDRFISNSFVIYGQK